jgi:pimeloyl-ACP methyl ester carboxylesterase
MRRSLVLALLVLSSVVGAPSVQADPMCTNVPAERRMSSAGVALTQTLGLASGKYALPATSRPTQLVVMMHGYGNDSCAWRNHLRQAAAHGAVGIAMDYSKQNPKTNRGWYVKEGAEDSIAAAKYFMKRYPSIRQVYLFGISMGGNSSGVALISPNAKRANGKPLFDNWIAVEGVHNLIQEYMLFRAASAEFDEDVRNEAGGTFEEVPDRYVALTNVLHAQEMSYLKSAILVHGVDDLLVANPQSRQMANELRAVGVPTELFTVLGRGDGEQGTTISALAGQPVFDAAGLGEYQSPLAGHGWEGSDTQLVIRLGFEQLWKVMAGKAVGPYREVVVHGEGLRVPAP